MTMQTMMELVRQRRRLTEPEARYYALQLLDAMRYLHSHNIIHRDLKLGNLFLSQGMEVRVGDFGLAAQLASKDERKRTICGTPNYIAPEILDGTHGHSFEVDTWALGVIIYTMLIGKPPFETSDVKATYKRIRENSYTFPESVPVSPSARDLVMRILQPNPAARLTLTQILEHDFFMHPSAVVPTIMPASALVHEPLPEQLSLRSSAEVARDLLHRPVGSLLIRSSASSSSGSNGTALAPTSTAVPMQAPAAFMAPQVRRLPTVPDVSNDTATTGGASLEMADAAEVAAPRVALAPRSAPAAASYNVARSMAEGGGCRPLHQAQPSWRATTSAMGAASHPHPSHDAMSDDKENAYPAMHAGFAAAKRTLTLPQPAPVSTAYHVGGHESPGSLSSSTCEGSAEGADVAAGGQRPAGLLIRPTSLPDAPMSVATPASLMGGGGGV
ncbi:MAG: hypothetical protein EOO41_04105, partial [Methanobacteriota archaeon]